MRSTLRSLFRAFGRPARATHPHLPWTWDQTQLREATYRAMFATMDQAFCVIALERNAMQQVINYRYVETNPAFERQSGLAGAVGRTILELVPDFEPELLVRYGEVQASGLPMRFESEVPSMERWFDIQASRIGGPASTQLAVLFSDITGRKRADAELQRLSGALRHADRQKSDFLAVLAHELRNPLTPLVTGLQLLRKAPGNQPVVERTGQMMQRQLDHMVRLIDELMDVARIDSGKVRLTRVRTELSVVIESALDTSMPLIEQRGHALEVDLPAQPVWLDIDPVRMVQVLANLLNNAAKYTPPGGKLALAVRREGDDVVIAVTDNGVGIETGALGGVFDLFSQVPTSSEMAQGGLGIGLALVQQLVHLHGGKVTAHSEGAGCGCVFTVRLSSTPARKYEPQPLPTVAVRSWRTGDGVGRPVITPAESRGSAFGQAAVAEHTGAG